ncbi:hypothetical protein IAD21_05305 [Abditibacteriota bacterium]|nr:hypothetical protein IAD21_05305 [Abditibacteriota bacterium]
MNCPQCQEQLDERLDELRSGIQTGTLSHAAARAQAHTALQDAVRQCSACEAELSAHLQLRLSLMLTDAEVASIAVPPAIRVNVRRALERENSSRSYAARNPFKGFAWTGGAIMSAVALFVIARPYLIERAQAPVSDSAISVQAPAPDSVSSQDSTPSSAPKNGTAAKPPLVRAMPPKIKRGALPALTPGKATQQSPVVVAPPDVVSPQATSPTSSEVRQSAPRTRVRPRVREGAARNDNTSEKAPPSREAAPPSPKLSLPMVGSAAPSGGAAKTSGSDSAVPATPHLDSDLLASSGKALGLTVRFVRSPSAETEARMTTKSNNFAAPAPPAPLAPAQDGSGGPPAMVPAPVTKPATPGDEASTSAPTPPSSEQRAMRSRIAPGASGTSPTMSDSANNPEAVESSPNRPKEKGSLETGSLSVSVNEAVTNARVVGQVQGRSGDGILLWSGNALAHKPITVPLEPLEASKGDKVNIAFQQQVSLGETKTLATTSVVLP